MSNISITRYILTLYHTIRFTAMYIYLENVVEKDFVSYIKYGAYSSTKSFFYFK